MTTKPEEHPSIAAIRDCVEWISQEGWWGTMNDPKELVKILDEHKKLADNALPHLSTLSEQMLQMQEENERIIRVVQIEDMRINDILGKALGYPRYGDCPEICPDPTDDGIFVGEHVPATLAAEAAKKLMQMQEEISKLENVIDRQREWIDVLRQKRDQKVDEYGREYVLEGLRLMSKPDKPIQKMMRGEEDEPLPADERTNPDSTNSSGGK